LECRIAGQFRAGGVYVDIHAELLKGTVNDASWKPEKLIEK